MKTTFTLNKPKVKPAVDYKSLTETLALEALGDILEKTQEGAAQ